MIFFLQEARERAVNFFVRKHENQVGNNIFSVLDI